MNRERRDNEDSLQHDTGHEADQEMKVGPDADRDGAADEADKADDGGSAGDFFDGEEVEDDDEPPAGRAWVRNVLILLIVAALIGNALAFLPRIFNLQTLPLIFQSRELSGRDDVRQLTEAVVLVGTDKGKGSGFHVSDGYIVTNYHVIDDAAYIIVEFSGINRRFKAEVARFDPELDLAVLRVDGGGAQLPAIEVERERGWAPGDRVYVIGNPLALESIAVKGELAGTMAVRGVRAQVLMVDAPIHPGNSGSPVINEHGRAIAVVYATAVSERGDETSRVGLAVPLSEAETLLPDGRN